jgi:hypothetical protein
MSTTAHCSSLGEFHQSRHAIGAARHAVADQHRIIGGDEVSRGLSQGSGVPDRGYDTGERGYAQAIAIGYRVLLQLRVEGQQDGSHGRGHRDLVGTHGRFGKMLQ